VKAAVFLAFVLAVASAAGTSIAQTPEARPGDANQGATKAIRNVSGTVRTASADTVVVAGKDKGRDTEWTFAVEPVTNIRKGSKSITAADLRTGDAVQVRYTERDGKAMAQSILVRAPKTK
jgi:hypothetical protein